MQRLVTAALVAGIFATGPAGATTANVFSPDVNEGDRSMEYRASFLPGSDGSPDVFSHRLHFQYAFNESWRARILGSQRSVDGGSLDYRSTQLEILWQYREDQQHGWDAALRFDFLVGDEVPDRFRLVWAAQRNLANGWQLRANALVGRQFGRAAAPGVSLETRGQATYSIGSGRRLGVELFSVVRSTANAGSFDDQDHKLGPVFKFRIAGDWAVTTSYLAGISDGAPDGDWRLMIAHGF